MALTDVTVRNAKAAAKPYKLADSLGLYLYVQPSGSKLWRRNYRFEGKQKTLALGQYPAVSLAKARERVQDASRRLADGIDPGHEKRQERDRKAALAGDTFEAVAREWLAKYSSRWTDDHRAKIERRLAHGERDKVRAAYNAAQHLPERRKMMQAWADYLDALRRGADVVPLHVDRASL